MTKLGRHDRIILLTERKTCQQKEQKKEEKDIVDRGRGVKGAKVLRTSKIKITKYKERYGFSYFCRQKCDDKFANKYIQQVIAMAPRTECLEKPSNDPTKENRRYWSTWKITVDETRQT